MARDVLQLIDAAYRLDVDDDEWLRGVAAAAQAVLDVGLGLFAVFYDASDPERFQIRNAVAFGLPEGVQSILPRHAQLFDRPWVEDTFLGFTCEHIRHPRLARHPAAAPQLLDELYGPHGVRDIFSINAVDPSGLGHQINVLQSRECRLNAATRARWSRVAAHLAAGRRLRQRLRQEQLAAEAVLDPAGKLVHAEGAAEAKDAREQLVASVRARERARGTLRTSDSDRAVAEWKGMVAARWTLIDHFESDGRRYLVARRNEPEVRGLDSLTERERCAVGFAALGHSNKLIAYEMGISPSTVSVLLLRAARRLDARSRTDLVRKYLAETRR